MRAFLCVALMAAAASCGELPVTEVVLYKNGVGYFVRAGELKAGESAALRFKAGDMNDVLKSLTLVEAGGGAVTGLRYDASEPLGMKLEAFPFRMHERQPLSALLDQLRGARVELRTGAEAVAGLIVSARETGGAQQLPREQAALLLDSGELRTVDLAGITAVRFTDAAIQGQLKEYLATVATSRSEEKRSVYIDSTGAKARRLTASYVIPAPVWKSSYRLIFGETGEPALEGWAIVDNTTGEDWSKVRLALVSGRPVSFVSNLYEPRYVNRVSRDVLEQQAAAPELHRAAVAAAPAPAAGRFKAADMAAAVSEPVIVPSTVASQAGGSERGELFEYRFDAPVTVRSGESAMLPFLQQKIAARKLLIYSDEESEHPRNAAELTNSTGKTLDGGPITVFDGNAYGGEALVETVKAGDKRLISYAVDLGTRITTAFDSSRGMVREAHLRRGVLTLRYAAQETRTYTIRNVDRKAKTLVVEHAIRPGYRLTGAKPVETTASAYRFEVKLGPDSTAKLPVAEERVYDQTLVLTNATPDVFVSYVQNKDLDAAVRKQLEAIAAKKRQIAASDTALRDAEQRIAEIVRDQDRLRQNIASLNRVSGQQDQVQKYAAQLAAQEVALASLRDAQSEARKNKAALESELNQMIETAEF